MTGKHWPDKDMPHTLLFFFAKVEFSQVNAGWKEKENLPHIHTHPQSSATCHLLLPTAAKSPYREDGGGPVQFLRSAADFPA